MPFPGTVWAGNSWDINAWAANTWQNAETPPVVLPNAYGAVYMTRARMRRHGALAFALLLCVVLA